MILVTMRIMKCDNYEDDFDNDLIMKKPLVMIIIIMVVAMMASTEMIVHAFVLQVWLNINWVWVGGGLFPLTW